MGKFNPTFFSTHIVTPLVIIIIIIIVCVCMLIIYCSHIYLSCIQI